MAHTQRVLSTSKLKNTNAICSWGNLKHTNSNIPCHILIEAFILLEYSAKYSAKASSPLGQTLTVPSCTIQSSSHNASRNWRLWETTITAPSKDCSPSDNASRLSTSK